MEKSKIFRDAQDGFNAWFSARGCRRVFVIGLLLSVGLATFWQITQIEFMRFSFLGVALITIIASIWDTATSLGQFNASILLIQRDFKIQQAEEGASLDTSPFEGEELKAIAIERWKFKGMIIMKVILVIILLAWIAI